jgi:hypothetical protein
VRPDPENFSLGGAIVIAHLQRLPVVLDVPMRELAVTVDGTVWERQVGGWQDPPPPQLALGEGWTRTGQIPKAQVADWLGERLTLHWVRL